MLASCSDSERDPGTSQRAPQAAGAEGVLNSVRPTLIADCFDPCSGIELERVASLGSPEDSVLLNWHSTLAAGAQFIAAGRVPSEGVVPLFTYEGSQVHVVGRHGGGPGWIRRDPSHGSSHSTVLRAT